MFICKDKLFGTVLKFFLDFREKFFFFFNVTCIGDKVTVDIV